jgi:hypothetical protein
MCGKGMAFVKAVESAVEKAWHASPGLGYDGNVHRLRERRPAEDAAC